MIFITTFTFLSFEEFVKLDSLNLLVNSKVVIECSLLRYYLMFNSARSKKALSVSYLQLNFEIFECNQYSNQNVSQYSTSDALSSSDLDYHLTLLVQDLPLFINFALMQTSHYS